jgi:divalent metal cation (Fe/Co/Zn/Cd) transporter
MNGMDVQAKRVAQVRIGVRVEVFTVLWMVVEAVVSIGAGVLAQSALLTAFGIDSVIELVSGAILLWRLSVEVRGEETGHIERAEQRAAWVVAVSLALLCVYVLATAAYGLITRSRPESSVLGVTKRRIASRIDSSALRGDAASSFTCGYMAGAVLLGVGLNALFHWWWAEDVASLLFLFWLLSETREALEEAREEHEDKG